MVFLTVSESIVAVGRSKWGEVSYKRAARLFGSLERGKVPSVARAVKELRLVRVLYRTEFAFFVQISTLLDTCEYAALRNLPIPPYCVRATSCACKVRCLLYNGTWGKWAAIALVQSRGSSSVESQSHDSPVVWSKRPAKGIVSSSGSDECESVAAFEPRQALLAGHSERPHRALVRILCSVFIFFFFSFCVGRIRRHSPPERTSYEPRSLYSLFFPFSVSACRSSDPRGFDSTPC